jgi:hypothetical protein
MTHITSEFFPRSNGWWDFVTSRFHASTLSPIIVEVENLCSPEAFHLMLGFDQGMTIFQFDLMALVIPEIYQLYMTTLSYLALDLTVTIPQSFIKDRCLYCALASM